MQPEVVLLHRVSSKRRGLWNGKEKRKVLTVNFLRKKDVKTRGLWALYPWGKA